MDVVEAKILDSTHLELNEPIAGRPGESVRISINPAPAAGKRFFDRPNGQTAPPDGHRALPPQHREREQAWRRSHDEVLRELAGQWVVLEGEEIVAHGDDPEQLVEEARAKGIGVPYIFYVAPQPPNVVKLGL